MKLETKYDLNQQVYPIQQEHRKEWILCPACGGSGHVTLLNGTRPCPDCYGRAGHYESRELEWRSKGALTIGRVNYQITNIETDGMFDNVGHYKEGNDEVEIEYMAYETGIDSGSLWNEDQLFSTLEDAEAECAKRNQEKGDE